MPFVFSVKRSYLFLFGKQGDKKPKEYFWLLGSDVSAGGDPLSVVLASGRTKDVWTLKVRRLFGLCRLLEMSDPLQAATPQEFELWKKALNAAAHPSIR